MRRLLATIALAPPLPRAGHTGRKHSLNYLPGGELRNFLDVASRNRGLHVVTFLALLNPEEIIALLGFRRDLAVTHLPALDVFSVGVGHPVIPPSQVTPRRVRRFCCSSVQPPGSRPGSNTNRILCIMIFSNTLIGGKTSEPSVFPEQNNGRSGQPHHDYLDKVTRVQYSRPPGSNRCPG